MKFAKDIQVDTIQDNSRGFPIYFFTDKEKYKIVGAGWCDLKGKRAEFFGTSMDYQMGIDTQHLLNSIRPMYKDMEILHNPRRYPKKLDYNKSHI